MTLSVSPQNVVPGMSEVWTIKIFPTATVTGAVIDLGFNYPNAIDINMCTQPCTINTQAKHVIFKPASFSSPLTLTATTSFTSSGPYAPIVGSAAMTDGGGCCIPTQFASLYGPHAKVTLTDDAPPIAPTGTTVHVTLTYSMNVAWPAYVADFVPVGLDQPTSVQPAAIWHPGNRELEWDFTAAGTVTMRYTTRISAPTGTKLAEHALIGGPCYNPDGDCSVSATILVGIPATPRPTPAPTPRWTPIATLRPTTPTTPTMTASPTTPSPTITPRLSPTVTPIATDLETATVTPSTSLAVVPGVLSSSPPPSATVPIVIGTTALVAGSAGLLWFRRRSSLRRG